MNFDQFVKGGRLNDPKTALDVKAGEKLKKEPTIDQVKRASLSTDLETNEPDYTKTQANPIQEDLTVDDAKLKADAQKQIDSIDQQLAALERSNPDKNNATYITNRTNLNNQKKVIIDKLKTDQAALAKAATV